MMMIDDDYDDENRLSCKDRLGLCTFIIDNNRPNVLLFNSAVCSCPGCELSKENPFATWAEAVDDDEQDYLRHTLFLKQVGDRDAGAFGSLYAVRG